MSKSVFIIYQNIDSGAKVVTEEVISHLKQINPTQPLIVYRQNPHQFSGFISALKNFYWSFTDCVKQIESCPFDTKVIYTPYYLAVFAHFLSRKKHIPIIFHFHGDHAITHIDKQLGFFWPLKFFYIWLFGKIIEYLQTTSIEQANQVIFVAKQAKKDMIRKYHLKLRSNKVKIIHNGVANHLYRPAKSASDKRKNTILRVRLGFKKDQHLILYSGRIDRKKGIHKILIAIKKINSYRKKNQFGFIIVHPSYRDKDSANYYYQLTEFIKKYALPVVLVSHPPQLITYYQLADVCILPSEQEMMPLVMLESLSSGTPFFGTKVGNISEILNQVNTNLVLTNSSAKAIVSALHWWQNLKATERYKLNEKSTKTAHNYSWQATAKAVQQVIAQLVDSPHQKNQ